MARSELANINGTPEELLIAKALETQRGRDFLVDHIAGPAGDYLDASQRYLLKGETAKAQIMKEASDIHREKRLKTRRLVNKLVG